LIETGFRAGVIFNHSFLRFLCVFTPEMGGVRKIDSESNPETKTSNPVNLQILDSGPCPSLPC